MELIQMNYRNWYNQYLDFYCSLHRQKGEANKISFFKPILENDNIDYPQDIVERAEILMKSICFCERYGICDHQAGLEQFREIMLAMLNDILKHQSNSAEMLNNPATVKLLRQAQFNNYLNEAV